MGDEFDTVVERLEAAKAAKAAAAFVRCARIDLERTELRRPDEDDKSSVWLAYSQIDTINEILNAISALPGVADRIEAYLIGRGFEDARDDIDALRKAVC